MKDYIGIILLESELAECVDYLPATQLRYQLGEFGFDSTQVTERIDRQILVHNLIFDAIRYHKMRELTRALGCMPIQIETWLEWARQFDLITERFNFDKVLTAIQATPQVTAKSTETKSWEELISRLADVGDETYLICFYLASMFGLDFDFTSLPGDDEEARSRNLVAKCIAECKLVALLTIMDALGVAAEMPHLQNLVARWMEQAIADDRKCG